MTWSKFCFDRLKIKQWVAGLYLGHSKLFIFIWKKLSLEHQMLDQWDDHPIDPVTQRIILKIVGFQFKIHEINLNILFQNKSISEKEPRVGLYQKEFGNIYSLPIAREWWLHFLNPAFWIYVHRMCAIASAIYNWFSLIQSKMTPQKIQQLALQLFFL